MKRIIDRKVYDTDTAELIHDWNNGIFGDFRSVEESLYCTKNGSYFIAGSGGAMTRYAKSCGNNNTSGSSSLWVVSESEAIDWLEEHNGEDALLEHFSEAIEQG